MMKAFKFILLFVSICIANIGWSQDTYDVYLEYSESCMDRYVYRLNSNYSGEGYIAYRINLNEREAVILEVGSGNSQYTDFKPSETRSCRELAVGERFVEDINNEDVTVYIVKKDQYGYSLNPVQIASYLYRSPYELGYSTKGFTFSYNYNQTSGENTNIATNDSEVDIYSKGADTDGCPKRFNFRKVSYIMNKPYTDFTLVPEVGITFVETEDNNRSELASVNNKPLGEYLKRICGSSTSSGGGLTHNGNTTNNNNNSSGRDYWSKDKNKDKMSGLEGGTSSGSGRFNDGTTLPPLRREYYECSHIYKDVDKGIYYDRNTGRPAEGFCGGITYRSGNMQGTGSQSTGTVVTTTPTTTTQTSTTTHHGSNHLTCGIYKDLSLGLYVDRDTGLPAEGDCGGNSYRNGVMLNSPDGGVFAGRGNTNPTPSPTPTPPIRRPDPTPTPTPNPPVSNCASVSTYGTHIVQPKETLYGIARRYDVSIAQLRAWNGLNRTNLIKPCQALATIPPSSGGVTMTGKGASSNVHIVRQKETLYGIAKRYGLTTDRLRRINGLTSSDLIHPGQQLALVAPQSFNFVAKGGESTTWTKPNNSYHVVNEGETMYSIAKKYGFTVARFRNMNGLNPTDVIRAGQKLVVSDCNCDPTTLNTNTAARTDLIPAEYEFTPKGGEPTVASTASRAIPDSYDTQTYYGGDRRIHVVKTKETLYSIAEIYNISVARLRALNDLEKDEVIIPKQRLFVN